MKTSVLYTYRGKNEMIRRSSDPPLFVPKGTLEGHRSNGNEVHTEFDSVRVPYSIYNLGNDWIRLIPEHYIEELDVLDQKIAALHQERADLLAEAFRHGRKVKRADCETVEQRRARRARNAAGMMEQ